VVGPLARGAADLSLALDVLAGPDPDEAPAWRVALPPARGTQAADWRVLVVTDHPLAAASSAVRATVQVAADSLAHGGATVRTHSPSWPDLRTVSKTFGAMVQAFVSQGQPGPVISAHEWMALLDEQARLRAQCAALFEAFDAVLMPTFGTTAFPHEAEPNLAQRTLRIDGAQTPYAAQGQWSAFASLARLPATVVPFGHDADGLPIGVQVVGPYLHDRTTLAVADWLDGHRG
jgi:amidase